MKFHLAQLHGPYLSFPEELDSHSSLSSERISLLSKHSPCLYVSLHPLWIPQQNSCFEKKPKEQSCNGYSLIFFPDPRKIPFFFPSRIFFRVKACGFKVHFPYSSFVLLYKGETYLIIFQVISEKNFRTQK